jgi:histidinol-phosphate aminotransferase
VIVDESFAAFATEAEPPTLAPLVADLPHLVVVNSLGKSHGIAGLRLGYAVMSPSRARRIRAGATCARRAGCSRAWASCPA